MVEALLAAAIFAMLTTAFVGAFVYGRGSSSQAGDRGRAILLADEGVQAVRNIRDANYTNLVDGTYGLVQTGGVWTLSGSSDTSGIYTRQVVIVTTGTLRRTATATVTWSSASGVSRQVSATGQLTNWLAALPSWANAISSGSYNAASTNDGLKVVSVGNYAYVVRAGGTPSFLILNVSTPSAPTLVGSLTLAVNPTNIFVSGSYAYVTTSSDTAELQIVNISTPASPTLVSSYNAAGAADGLAVYVSGSFAYLARAANATNAEFSIVNISTPATPTLTGSYSNNIGMNSVAVKGNYAYVGTSAGSVLTINVTTPASPTLTLSSTQTTTGAINGMDIVNNSLLIGQTTTMSVLDITTPTSPTRIGSVTTTGSAAVASIDIDSTGTYAFLGTNNTTAEFQVVNITTLTAPTIVRTVDISGTTSSLNGVGYNASLDLVVGASASDTQEAIIFVKS